MERPEDWFKLAVMWVATVGGYITEHLTLGRITLLATFVLTVMQAYKTWLDIKQKRRSLREENDDAV